MTASHLTERRHVGEAVYHVPRSQVWEGSRGRQTGHAHLHVTERVEAGRLKRGPGQAMCGRLGWYERPIGAADENVPRCPRCVDMAARYGVEWPA